ncbi:MAG: M48 family metalloprotease [Proteobacteria bacterium]|nr:M48 family metalloprotease [Pseudomonadota bacterium]NIS69287.1 M48 family metalloprotease [Pseudomonadota bacterium]
MRRLLSPSGVASVWERRLAILFVIIGSFSLFPVGVSVRENGPYWNEAVAFSVEQERELGEKVYQAIQSQMEIVQVPSIQVYIDSLGERLVSSASTSEFPIRFFIIKRSEPNAFAIPGGRIFVTTGLIRLVDSEDELAAVLSHEIAHVVRRHIAQRIEASKRLNIATLAGALAGILIGGSGGGAIMAGSLALGESEKLRYTRENESESDRLALSYMDRAGYEGSEMVSFLKKIYRESHHDTAFPPYLSTHPGIPSRISYLETLMGGLARPVEVPRSSVGLKDIKLRVFLVEKGPLESLNYFDRIINTQPNNGDAFFGRALAEKEIGRVKESIEDLKRAHELKPSDPQILKELGLAFLRSGRINEGVRALERSVVLSGRDPESLHYLGQGYKAQKKFDLAIESYVKARALSSDLPELDRDLGSVYKEKGEMGQSHFYYGLYFKRKGEIKYARFHFEKALELSAQDPQRQEEIQRELEPLRK